MDPTAVPVAPLVTEMQAEADVGPDTIMEEVAATDRAAREEEAEAERLEREEMAQAERLKREEMAQAERLKREEEAEAERLKREEDSEAATMADTVPEGAEGADKEVMPGDKLASSDVEEVEPVVKPWWKFW